MKILCKSWAWLVFVSLLSPLAYIGCSKNTATSPDTTDPTAQIRDENWLVGTWEGVFTRMSPFSGTRIRVTIGSASLVLAPERHIYEYVGSFTWDVDGVDLWSSDLEAGESPVGRLVWTDNHTDGSESIELHAVRDSADTVDLNWSTGLRVEKTPTQLLFAWKITHGDSITEPANVTQYVLMEKQP